MAGKDLLSFITLAEAALPQAMEDLKSNPTKASCLSNVVGLLVGSILCSTGHRKCVYVGMTLEDVEGAEAHKKTSTIRVSALLLL